MAHPSEDPVDAVVWMIRGQWVSLSIRAALELGIFDRLDTPRTVADLADAAACDPAALGRLVRVLADLQLVEVPGSLVGPHDVVSATSRGATLSRGHQSGLRDLSLMQTAMPNLASWQRLADALRTGDAVFETVNGIGPWESLTANPEQEATFNAAMARRGSQQAAAIASACDVAGAEMVVDVGGGRGALLGELLRANPGLRGIVAERPDVADAAQQHFAEHDLAERAGASAADFFDAVPGGGDIYVLANVLHDWGDGDAIQILRTVRAAASPRARLWIVEHVLDSPGRPFHELRDLHLVDLHMLVMFGARERTADEYAELLLAGGFDSGDLLTTTGAWDVIEARPA